MKNIILCLIILFCGELLFSQKIILHRNSGGNQILYSSSIDSITFLPFVCGDEIRYEGKTYNTVLIGEQCWLKENLDIGTMITGWPDNNGVIEKYCYDNLPANCETYGGLYMWGEAMKYVTNEGAQGICPTGWHIPTEAQYLELITFVNNNGNELKREDQGNGSGQGTNTSGFSGLLAGGKGYSGGPYYALGEWGSFWMSKGNTSSYAYTMQLMSDTNIINTHSGTMVSWGMSVRCIKD